jgi:hypothetical protein
MSVSVAQLKDNLGVPQLLLDGPFSCCDSKEDVNQVDYRRLEAWVETMDQASDIIDQLHQLCGTLNQVDKDSFLQQVAQWTPEDVVRVRRSIAMATQSLYHYKGPENVEKIRSLAQSDPRVASLCPPEKLTAWEKVVDVIQSFYQPTLKISSWIEEYMDDVIKQAQLPSWVGSLDLEADCSDHHLHPEIEYALALYQKGQVSIWKAAELAGLSLRKMMEQAAAHGLEPRYDPRMVEEEFGWSRK